MRLKFNKPNEKKLYIADKDKKMDLKKPENMSEYTTWLRREKNVNVPQAKNQYESVTSKILRDFNKSKFWSELRGNLKKYDDEYLSQKGYKLRVSDSIPEMQLKQFDSFLLKTYRKNILENINYPDEPVNGWIMPENWFYRINDILRTLFIVKYFDGIEFLIERLRSLCDDNGIECNCSFEAREEGYYAAHLIIKHSFEVPRRDWDTEKVLIPIEFQITTQLQEVIRRLLHRYYERARKRTTKPAQKWQWDYKSDEFATNYLGHILHYVEGMIMEIRENQRKEVNE